MWMTGESLNCEYFEWMYQTVYSKKYSKKSYRKLFNRLHNIEFYYIIEMDSNRAEDGINLRYRFCYEKECNAAMIASYLDTQSCSVLEMLIALAVRCEEHIMGDSDIGDRTSYWFWTMIANLNLDFMDDENYDSKYIDYVIEKFMNREYKKNGEGGLFVVDNRDLRSVEIWYQMCLYIDNIL